MSLKKLYPGLTAAERTALVKDIRALVALDMSSYYLPKLIAEHTLGGDDWRTITNSARMEQAVPLWAILRPEERIDVLNAYTTLLDAVSKFERKYDEATARACKEVHDHAKRFTKGTYFTVPESPDVEFRVARVLHDPDAILAYATTGSATMRGTTQRFCPTDLLRATILSPDGAGEVQKSLLLQHVEAMEAFTPPGKG